MDIDRSIEKYSELVCNKCKEEKVEKYSLLTQTEVRGSGGGLNVLLRGINTTMGG